MSLPVDYESYGYRFCKNLNEDVKLKSNEYGEWDLVFDGDEDWVNVNGVESMRNACIIAILTRFEELNFMPLYEGFGCRIHELIKANKRKSLLYKIQIFITDTLNAMRRVKKVNWVNVEDNIYNEEYYYKVDFNITAIIDDDYSDDINVTGEFRI